MSEQSAESKLVDFMVSRDGHIDEVATMIGEAIDIRTVEFMQDYLSRPTTDNALAFSRVIAEAVKKHIKRHKLTEVMND